MTPDVHVRVERAAWGGRNVDAHDRCVLVKQVIRPPPFTVHSDL